MSADDDELLLRRFRLRGGVSTNAPHDLQPTTTQGSGEARGGLPQPPNLNRQVQSVYDARPSLTREFGFDALATTPTSASVGTWLFRDFTFQVPDGYLGVWRHWTLDAVLGAGDSFSNTTKQFVQPIVNGMPLVDYHSTDTAAAAGQPNGLLLDDGLFGFGSGDRDIYAEIPPGGTFALRYFNNEVVEDTISLCVRVTGQFVRAENVPPELQIASPPQVTPIVPAPNSVWARRRPGA